MKTVILKNVLCGVLALLGLAVLAASPAFAHTGHGSTSSFAHGFIHPLTGLDHVLAMLAIGLLAGSRLTVFWTIPVAFVGAMLAGFLFQRQGGSAGFAEQIIILSVIALGLTLMVSQRVPQLIIIIAAAFFGFFHGYMHGVETGQNSMLAYGAGFMLATSLLHIAGVFVAQWSGMPSGRRLTALSGAVIAGTGVALTFLVGA
jgi:urease accessory protein